MGTKLSKASKFCNPCNYPKMTKAMFSFTAAVYTPLALGRCDTVIREAPLMQLVIVNT
jgi:hypothetical protein